MKADNTVLELGDASIPLFGDIEREYDFVQRLVEFQGIDSGIAASVASFEGVSARVHLTFVTPEIIRVQCMVGKEAPASTPMLDGPLPSAPAVEIEEHDDAIVVSSSALTLRIEKQPFRWLLFDRDGTLVTGQEIYDGTLREYVSFPMGWSTRPGQPAAFHETLKLRPNEQIYGLGESFGALNRRGTRVVSWSRDTHGTNTTPLTYLNIPFFLSTHGYGVFINQTGRIIYELGHPSQASAAFRVDEPYLDYFLMRGRTPTEIIERYWALTGRGVVPPLWSFGVWMSRCMYRDAEQARNVVERLRSLDIPLDVINVDPRWLEARKHHERDACDFVWDKAAFGTTEEFVGWLGERGVRLCLWENPYVWKDTAFYEEGAAKGYFATTDGGSPAPTLENPREAVTVDFTNPDAARWWQDQHRPLLRAGVAAFKSDYGEGVPAEAHFHDGTTGRETHNVYPLLYNRAVWDVIKEEHGEAIVFGRSGYAGSQRYPINWVGDTQCTWEGMAAALRAGLSLSLSGVPFWSQDIGGFWNPQNLGHGPDPELYIRWAQWGLLLSHSRFHGVRGREPWWYGDDAVDVVRKFAKLRYRLLPYIWSFANEAVATATPLVRPLVLEFPDDPTTRHVDTQFMLGPWLLVAPVFEPGGRQKVYLPPGRWHDYWSGEQTDGARWLDSRVPLDRIPLYVRDDSLLPFAPGQTHIGERPWSPLELHVRVSNEASLRVNGEGVEVDAQARLAGGVVVIDLSGRGDLVMRCITPAVSSAEVTGDASEVKQDSQNGVLSVSLKLNGTARLTAR